MKNPCIRGWLLAGALAVLGLGQARASDVPPAPAYATAAEKLSEFIRREMREKGIPAISIALVDGQSVVWAAGFGEARTNVAANADTIYRVGSVSKLFTDIAIMQLAEKGALNLDDPVAKHLPNFQPRNPFGKEPTVRQLMAHRSGLCRESPVGNYFDPSEPTLGETIASLNSTELVYEPGTREKYSNAGIAALGYLLETAQKTPYPAYIEDRVLRPLGLAQSAFRPTPEIKAGLADGQMWTVFGRTFAAPKFELGIAPAGCMYSSVNELGRFMTVLFNGGRTARGPILQPATLEQMWTVQFGAPGATEGYGLGFHMQRVKGERMAGHGGAIYGFSTHFSALVDAKLGAVVIASKDFANTVADKIGMKALVAMLSVKNGIPFPDLPKSEPLPLEQAKALEGTYANGERGFDLIRDGAQITLLRHNGGYPQTIRKGPTNLVADGVTAFGAQYEWDAGRNALRSEGTEYLRQPSPKPAETPSRWRPLIGEYGWDHDTLYIFERRGKLWALIEWVEFDPLEEISENVFAFPNRGLYHGEKLVFVRDASGKVAEVTAANVHFKRRSVGPENGTQLQLKPTRPIAELRQEALQGRPPEEKGEFRKSDLVELVTVEPSLKLDIRYARNDNFLGTPFYTSARAFLQKPAAEAVSRVAKKLAAQGYGLMIFDGYRPWFVTKIFWEATPLEHRFLVANPADGSRHNRGCAVDLSLYDLKTGRPIEMVGTYDEASDRTYPEYPGGTSLQRWHRELLRGAMESEGFTVYPEEWWHFDYNEWRKYPLQNIPFEDLK